MSDRISIKGKGDELFFATESGASKPSSLQEQDAARQTDSTLAGEKATKTDRTTERQTARQTDESSGEKWPAEMVGLLRQMLVEDHPTHNTFRYSQRILDAVRDIVYELEVKRGIKTSRNDVMRSVFPGSSMTTGPTAPTACSSRC